MPDLAWGEIAGFEVTRLGNRHRPKPASPSATARATRCTGSARPGSAQDSGPGTDFHAVRNGFISITPIQVDLTRYQALEKVASWVSGLRDALGRPA